MDKDQALEEFFKILKKAFNISCLFTKEHPSFIKSIQDFKNTVDPLFAILNPIKFGVTADSFLWGEKYFSGGLLYTEMAKMLHLRRIEAIEMKAGVTADELIVFFSNLALHPKEIMAAGGIVRVLNEAKATHISVKELDYSQLLKGSGSDCKDIWIYLLREAVEQDDPGKVNALADNFQKMIQHFKIKDLLENPESNQNIHRFLEHLKNKGQDKFLRCSKEVARSILKEKDISQESDLDKIRMFFEELREADLSDILSDGLLTDEGFDPLSFSLFSKILDEDKHKAIAAQTAKSLEEKPVGDRNKIRKNIEKLFSVSGDSAVSEVYRHTLSNLLSETSFKNQVIFDRELAHRNYDLILLNLLVDEKNEERLNTILEKLNLELDKIIRKRDLEYLVFLLETIDKKRTESHPLQNLFDGMERLIYNFVEHSVCEEENPADFEYFISRMQKSSLGINFYLDKIFKENRVTPNLLKLFFRLFHSDFGGFYQNLEEKKHDLVFLEMIIEVLEEVDTALTPQVLKQIYSFSNNFIRVEVLKAMQKLSEYDTDFLLSILKTGDVSSKKEALIALMKDELARKKALEILFSIKSPWGRKNGLILENIIVVEEAKLKAASDYLVAISKKRFFWNRNIRRAALKVLKKWAQ